MLIIEAKEVSAIIQVALLTCLSLFQCLNSSIIHSVPFWGISRGSIISGQSEKKVITYAFHLQLGSQISAPTKIIVVLNLGMSTIPLKYLKVCN